MIYVHRRTLWGFWLLLAGLLEASTTRADVVSVVDSLREGGCGGTLPALAPLRHNPALDRTAQQWASGFSLSTASDRSGYGAKSMSGLHMKGPDSSLVQLLRRSRCAAVSSEALHDIGVYRRGPDVWLVVASAYTAPAVSQESVPARALQLINNVRARGTRCGDRLFAPAPPVRLSSTLTGVASGHAVDMAEHEYFEHEDLAGQSPAERVRAVGYREKLVGENIAYGPESVDEVVQGWLDSPGHCENVMDARFAEMGIAYAAGEGARRGPYWVQVFAAPRS
jgi:uncharacterized protein YkwD